MYEVGGYVYRSKKEYELLILSVILIFVACIFILYFHRDRLDLTVVATTICISILMIIHLIFRLLDSKTKFEYKFKNV